LNFELIGHLLIDITVSVLRHNIKLVKGGQYLAEVEAEISSFEDVIRNITIEL